MPVNSSLSTSMTITPITTSNIISKSINRQSLISKVFSRYLHLPGSHQSTRLLESVTHWLTDSLTLKMSSKLQIMLLFVKLAIPQTEENVQTLFVPLAVLIFWLCMCSVDRITVLLVNSKLFFTKPSLKLRNIVHSWWLVWRRRQEAASPCCPPLPPHSLTKHHPR